MLPALDAHLGLAAFAAALLFLVQIGLSVMLVAAAALTHVALRRMSLELGPRFGFVEGLHDASSAHRTAAAILRQLTLTSGVLLVMLSGLSAGLSGAKVSGITLGTLLAVLVVDAFVSRSLALWDARRALRRTVFLAPLAHLLLYVLVAPMRRILEWLERVQEARHSDDEEDDEEQDEEVEAYIEVGEREGILEEAEGKMMRSIVDLDATAVREIMTPRTEILALPHDTTVADARRRLAEAGHSRIPVYRETIDNVVGVLHVRDLLRVWDQGQEQAAISGHLREARFVPETLTVAELLKEMLVETHIAIVVDEYGGVAGLVTLEDLLEEIVGDIRDEHDREEVLVREEAGGAWLMLGAAHVEELETRFGLTLGERDFDTVGGFVVSELGRVPAAGESLESHGLRFEVVKADRRRIHQLRVRAHPAAADATQQAS